MVYPRRVLEEIVNVARTHGLFLIADETYARLAYDEKAFTPLAELVGDDVPSIVMRGLSKEVPWPGSRAGWIEVYNAGVDASFARYVKTLNDAKMLEVCSTTLPQRVLPKLFSDPRYYAHVRERVKKYADRADRAYAALGNLPGIIAPRSESSFYYSVVFEDLPERGTLPIENDAVRKITEEKVKEVAPDKRFVYYLLASTGICVVPLSGFNTDILGFRMTLLEPDEAVFDTTLKRISDAIIHYHASA
jgi:alanine-synthesizing transaminase